MMFVMVVHVFANTPHEQVCLSTGSPLQAGKSRLNIAVRLLTFIALPCQHQIYFVQRDQTSYPWYSCVLSYFKRKYVSYSKQIKYTTSKDTVSVLHYFTHSLHSFTTPDNN